MKIFVAGVGEVEVEEGFEDVVWEKETAEAPTTHKAKALAEGIGEARDWDWD